MKALPFPLLMLGLALCIVAFAACDSDEGGGGDGGDGNNVEGVTAVFDNLSGPERNFVSDVVFTTSTSISFGFSATDGDYTINISLQSLEGDPLPLATTQDPTMFFIGPDPDGNPRTLEGVEYFASASVVIEADNGNTVLNALGDGGGFISFTTLNSELAFGAFEFDAASVDNPGAEGRVRQGRFSLGL